MSEVPLYSREEVPLLERPPLDQLETALSHARAYRGYSLLRISNPSLGLA